MLFAFGFLFNACSTDVDLYADYKDITVVYGMLDALHDTNYIKINKAFLGPGNALIIAKIEDSCNYPGKLDVKLKEYRANASGNTFSPTNRVLQLDTITIHNKSMDGYFYAPLQKVYYTKEPINNNNEQYKYQYELIIDRGDTILTSRTNIVSTRGVSDISTAVLNCANNVENGTLLWYPFTNAEVYEVMIKFYYKEVKNSDTVDREVNWSLGTYLSSNLVTDHGRYVASYKTSMFFSNLASYLGSDTLDQSIERIIFNPCVKVSIAAGGEELYDFISVNSPSSSIVQNTPEYSNIIGGYGVFSSRTYCEKSMSLSSQTFLDLMKHTNWNFRQGRGLEFFDDDENNIN